MVFFVFMGIGVFGYVGFGDPINWPLVLVVSVLATIANDVIFKLKG